MMDAERGNSSGSKNKWLVGLGIGCGAIIVIIILLFTGGYYFVKNMARGFKESENKMSELAARHGRVEEFCPHPSGAIEPDRLETFLKAREAAAPSRQRLEASFEQLVKDKGSFAAIRRGLGVVPQVADYLRGRNQALLDAGMGMGEYFFIYMIAYESYLKKPIDDGPGFSFPKRGGLQTDWEGEDAKEMQKDFALRRMHRPALSMLKNQLAKLATENAARGAAVGTSGREAGKEIPSPWQEALAAEVKAMEADPHRLPWQDGLPGILETSLMPFRDRLEASYSPMTNIFEISYEQK
jgi:hypothetical protein